MLPDQTAIDGQYTVLSASPQQFVEPIWLHSDTDLLRVIDYAWRRLGIYNPCRCGYLDLQLHRFPNKEQALDRLVAASDITIEPNPYDINGVLAAKPYEKPEYHRVWHAVLTDKGRLRITLNKTGLTCKVGLESE